MTSRPKAAKPVYDNSGRVAFITGGAQGIGQAIVQAWLESGGIAWVADVNTERRALVEAWGARFVECDVTRYSHVEEAVATVVQSEGALDVFAPIG